MISSPPYRRRPLSSGNGHRSCRTRTERRREKEVPEKEMKKRSLSCCGRCRPAADGAWRLRRRSGISGAGLSGQYALTVWEQKGRGGSAPLSRCAAGIWRFIKTESQGNPARKQQRDRPSQAGPLFDFRYFDKRAVHPVFSAPSMRSRLRARSLGFSQQRLIDPGGKHSRPYRSPGRYRSSRSG